MDGMQSLFQRMCSFGFRTDLSYFMKNGVAHMTGLERIASCTDLVADLQLAEQRGVVFKML